MKSYFVTAIGTDSGKTLVSAILVNMLQSGYWKPIQAGLPRDTDTVKSLTSSRKVTFFEEKYNLKSPSSPHHAAALENIQIRLDDFTIPPCESLVIEGAGGVLVPLNRKDTMLDLIRHCKSEVVLVCNLYLGSINHSLLTIDVLQRHNIVVKGIVFNGNANPSSQNIILEKSKLKCLFSIPKLKEINASVVQRFAKELKMKG